MTKLNISIPQPCHENWDAMKPEKQGRFCDSCQKKVFDFTHASDREIVSAFQQNKNLCGRFLDTQLNRDLVKPEKKSQIWLATTSALISFIGFGTQEAMAQAKSKTEQTDRKVIKNKDTTPKENILFSGIVYDENNTPIPHLGMYTKGIKIGETNENGNFSVYTHLWAWIYFRQANEDDEDATEYHVTKDGNRNCNVEINIIKYNIVRRRAITAGGAICVKSEIITKRRTLFGRIFYRIGNLFRKNHGKT